MLALLAALALAAAPQPLARAGGTPVLAGGNVLFARTRGTALRVFAIPATGGAVRRVFAYDGPAHIRPRLTLAGSPGQATGIVSLTPPAGQLLGGPPLGPWTAITHRGEPLAAAAHVEGDRVFA